MATTENLEAFKIAAKALRSAHYDLLRAWEAIDRDNGPEREKVDVGYPYDCSFDELFVKLSGWIDDLNKIGKGPELTKEEQEAAIRNPETVAKLAKAFGRELLDDVGLFDVRAMIEDNKEETDPTICHSHDYCDANMDMYDAGLKLGLDLDWGNADHSKLVDEAWTLAKSKAFFVEELLAEAEAEEAKDSAEG